MRRAAESAPVAEPRRARTYAVAALALAAAVILGFSTARLTAPPAPVAALHMRAPPRLALAPETTLKPSNDARFERVRQGATELVTLKNGTVDLTVRPLQAGERFVIRTDDAEVEVRGTALRVEAEGGKIRSVAVAEGTVEVRYAGFSAVIPSGGSWKATGEAAAPQPAPTPAPQAAPLPQLAAAPAAPASRPRLAARAAPEPPPLIAPEPKVAEPPPPAPPPAPTMSPASLAFADAMSAMRRGDYAASALQLEKFAGTHASDPRSDEADLLRAIALQRAGRSAEAAAAASRYLAARPSGAHRAEAKRIADAGASVRSPPPR
jgi:hypothetical protein